MSYKNSRFNFDAFYRQNGPFIIPQYRDAQKKFDNLIFFFIIHKNTIP